MQNTLPLPAARGIRHWEPRALFTSPWLALAVPLLVPLVVLFG